MVGKSAILYPSGAEIPRLRSKEIHGSTLPRKTSKHKYIRTVPQTDTGAQVE